MKLLSIALRNFRGVSDSTVAFSAGVTVVAGPNEVGKSSIAEAFRLIRREKASSKKAAIKNVEPIGVDAGPEVELRLRTGPYELTFAKRWVKRPMTELRVTAPRPEQLSGDDAHSRFQEILAETVDVDLLDALDVAQGDSLDQPPLAQIVALQSALDEGEAHDAGDGHDALLARIQEEHDRYFTAGGRPTGRYRSLGDELEQLRGTVGALEAASTAMDRLTDDHERYAHLHAELLARVESDRADLLIVEGDAAQLTELKRAADEAGRAVLDAERVRDGSAAALGERAGQVDALTALQERAAMLERELSERADRQRATAEAFDAVRGQAADAEATADAARRALSAANSAGSRFRARAEHEELSARVGRVREASERATAAAAQVAQLLVDDAALAQLTELETALLVVESSRHAAAASVTVRKLGDAEVEIDGSRLEHAESTTAVLDTVRIDVPGVISVDVRPGTPPAELDRAVATAKTALATGLAARSVDSIEEARGVAQRRRTAVVERDAAAADETRELAGKTLPELEQLAASALARLSTPEGSEESDGHAEAGAASLAELERDIEDATTAEAAASDTHKAAQRALERGRSAADTAREAWVRASESAKGAARELETAASALASSRGALGDADLERALAAAEETLASRRATAASTDLALAEREPELMELALQNARDLVASTARQLTAAREDVVATRALLDERASEGIYDKLTDARAAFDAADEEWARLERAATAVRLLRSTMIRHRDEAQRRYVAPFREQVDRLGKLVFGHDFAAEIGSDLRIESRSLDGRTVPFESLSAGAREQLSLLGRLAVAELVSAEDGAPVILDDTLGFADPERLKRLNVVLNQVGRSAQVVLLTCQPKRFDSLGGVTVVRLSPP